MWNLKGLSGPAAGQTFNLQGGKNLIGRAPHCQVRIPSQGVSKEHAEITVYADKVSVQDLNSANGTFINGVRIQKDFLNPGDKLGLHENLFELVNLEQSKMNSARSPSRPRIPKNQIKIQSEPVQPPPVYAPPLPLSLSERVQDYFEKNLYPGLYELSKHFEFRWVLLGFVAVFIVASTFLSMIPMVSISQSSILAESKRRASSIARSLASLNQSALLQSNLGDLNVAPAETEEGVREVFIVQHSDGMILAPATRAGSVPDIGFVQTARRELRPISEEIDSQTIGASFPMGGFDPNTGEQTIRAHVVVIYEVGSLAFDEGKYLSLFFQTFLISCLTGLVIYVLMYKMIDHPIQVLNRQLDDALRTKVDHIQVDYQWPALRSLAGNIASLLTRYLSGDSAVAPQESKEFEAQNLVQLMTDASLIVSDTGNIIAANQIFADLVNAQVMGLVGSPLAGISDGALVQNLVGLCQGVKNTLQVQEDSLEFRGERFIIKCAGSFHQQQVQYFVFTIYKQHEEAA